MNVSPAYDLKCNVAGQHVIICSGFQTRQRKYSILLTNALKSSNVTVLR